MLNKEHIQTQGEGLRPYVIVANIMKTVEKSTQDVCGSLEKTRVENMLRKSDHMIPPHLSRNPIFRTFLYEVYDAKTSA
jgi:hypothetical protein